MLNYVYAVLESESRLALAALGLDPGIGMLHNDTRNRDSLSCDLMEPVRPQVNAFLLDWLRRENLRREWFFEERDGNCRLMGSFAVRLSQTAQMWRNEVAPFAEWISKALWSTRFKHTEKEGPATRLTQRKRRSRNTELASPFSEPTPVAKCDFEAEHVEIVKIQKSIRRNMIRASGIIGHDPIARARRSETQGIQAAARQAWDPKDKPEWLDEKFYREKIQPELIAIPVPTIQSTLSVSEPYALRIRGRKCIPHPRHWLALGTLSKTPFPVDPKPCRNLSRS